MKKILISFVMILLMIACASCGKQNGLKIVDKGILESDSGEQYYVAYINSLDEFAKFIDKNKDELGNGHTGMINAKNQDENADFYMFDYKGGRIAYETNTKRCIFTNEEIKYEYENMYDSIMYTIAFGYDELELMSLEELADHLK